MLRHISINSILNVKDKVRKYSDEVVLCVDGPNYWRKQFFPYYKQNRKKQQKKDSFNWDEFFVAFNQLKKEFKEHLPYKYVEVETAEADDVIAVICRLMAPHTNICIVSTDKDLLQIPHVIAPGVKQYSPTHRKIITDSTPYSLFEHVVKGDDGDGVPNIFSDDDTFVVEGKRQTSIMTVKLKEWAKTGLANPDVFCKSIEDLERFERNRTLIDLTRIPQDLQDKIVDEYNAATIDKSKVFNYLVANRLMKIIERGGF